jgi:farnesyl-diphosphate farnesyltransferase
MGDGANVSAHRLETSILRSVSRSFYLSVRLLPQRLREPVGLGYLLARATDTIADTVEIPASLRKEKLRALASAIQGEGAAEEISDLQESVAPFQHNEAEQSLIDLLPQCLQRLQRLDGADRADIQVLLAKITRAQAMDVERFGDAARPRALPTTADLEEYAYLIAGCVGEFWTHLCARHIGNFCELPQEQMLDLGRRYGIGLQLINILRDAGVDLRAGRCYLPANELQAVGLDASQILADPSRAQPVYQKWLEEAERGLESGMEYVRAIRNRRVRAATALPALIGARTIALLRAAGPKALGQKIKVPRREVRGVIASVAITLAARKTLHEMFRKALL